MVVEKRNTGIIFTFFSFIKISLQPSLPTSLTPPLPRFLVLALLPVVLPRCASVGYIGAPMSHGTFGFGGQVYYFSKKN